MAKDDLRANSADDRRDRAEKRLAAIGVDLQSMPLENVQELVHELQVHQIELEMQNEELRRAQEEIQAARTKYADLYEFAPVGYFTFDRRGFILETNLTGARLLGTEKQQVIGTPFFLQVAPEDRKLLHAHLQKVFASRVNHSCELKLAPREGVSIHLALESVAVYDHEGDKPQCRSAVTDITAEQPLKQEIARLASFPQLNPNPILEIDLTGAIAFYNEAAIKKVRKLGLEDLRSLLPDDLDKTMAVIRQKGEKGFCLEIKKEDMVFFVHAHYTPQCQSIRLYYTDVTARKLAESALQESESRMRAIFEQAAVGVAEIETATGRFIRVNHKFCEIVGLSPEEMTATNFMAITLPEDLEVDLQYIQKLLHGQIRNFSREKRYRRQDGSVVWVNQTVSPMWEVGEAPNYHISVVEDITTRKAAEETLRLSEFKYRELFNNIRSAVAIYQVVSEGEDFVFLDINRALERIEQVKREDIVGRKLSEVFPGVKDFGLFKVLQRVWRTGIPELFPVAWYQDQHISGWRHNYVYQLLSGEVVAVYDDVTEKKQAEEALKQSEATLKGIFKAAPIGIGLVKNRRFGWTNEQLSNITGYSAEELQGQSARLLYESDEEFARVGQVKYDQIRKSGTDSIETRFRCKDGSVRDILLSSTPLDPAHPTEEMIFTAMDITERRRAREELYLEKEKYRVFTEESPLGVAIIDSSCHYRYLNPKFVEIFGYTLADIPTGKDWFTKAFPDSLYRRQVMSIWMNDLRLAKVGESRPRTFAVICKNGREKIIHFRPVTLGTQDQLIIYEDITERFRDEETLKSLIANAPIGIFIIQAGRFVLINPGFEAITGYRGQDLLGKDHLTLIPSEYKAIVRMKAIKVLKKADTSPYEYQFISKNGETGWVMETIIPTHYEGKRAVLGYFMDTTAHKKLENQFLQAQRMEAVGRLAGGLAHDFNNVLAIIVIYVETILKEIHPGDPLTLQAKGIREASLRAISLTRQLMAVGRRQVLQPRAINLNALVGDMESMLRRLMGEDVELVLTLDQVETVAKVDPSQLEQVLLNLVVNARDAMPQGGKLTITITHTLLNKSDVSQRVDVTSGHYVVLAVSDTGIGMDQETQSHILEPFYTTKPSSKGTGLGLSSVYGIVKQSGGFMEVDSESGKGATFKIFLPAAQETFEAQAKITESPLLRGSETILLVEDVDELRQLLHDILKNCGYTVLTAEHGKEALLISDQHQGPIHLLVLDVVLPQMSGGELAERLKSMYPGAKVLYMSGYPEDAIIHRKVLNGAVGFIQKPFSPIDLASKVREVLASSPQVLI